VVDMPKLKLYLDTSVVSHLDAPDAPEKMADTIKLWEDIYAGIYEVCVSNVTIDEIDDCPEPKRTFMFSKLAEIKYTHLEANNESTQLSKLYFSVGGLPPKSKEDAQHIAIATVNDCDIILSWNFKHIVNLRAMRAVEEVNRQRHYKTIHILSPTMMLDMED
jgi:predicted nucleic acid-binding protein